MTEHEKPQITAITPEAVWREGQTPIPGYRVEFTTPAGHKSYVNVPRSEDVHHVAAQAVEEESQRLDALAAQYPRKVRNPLGP